MTDYERFLELLDPDCREWHFRTIPKSGGTPRIHSGSLNHCLPQLIQANAQDDGVFVVVNDGGQKGQEINRIRALFVDFDEQDDHLERLKAVPFVPSIIVESSPGKHHAYWLVDGCPVDKFTAAQKALIGLLGSDKSINDLPRVMRLPGFWHCKGERFESRLIHESGDRYQWPDFSAWLETLQPAIHSTAPERDRYMERICGDIAMARDGERNSQLYQKAVAAFAGAVEGKTLAGPDKIEQSLTEAALRAGLGADEIAATLKQARCSRIASTARPAANETDPAPPTAPSLHEFAPDLLALPGGLGKLQRYIHARMIYPSAATAGVTAIAAAEMIAQQRIALQTPFGLLGFNEYHVIMASTTFGKESLRRAIESMVERMQERGKFTSRQPTMMQYALPASTGALHELLASWPCQTFLADEFAEWLCSTATDSHRQQAIGFLMEAYTKPFGYVSAPYSVSNKRQPIKNPRISIFATTTGERLLGVLTGSHADSGAYNRFVLFVAEQHRIAKRYDMPDSSAMLDDAADVLGWINNQPDETTVTFSNDALDYFKKHDSEIIEVLKYNDGRLAGRLSEQALKMAGVIALCDQRLVVEEEDLRTAYRIRESLYHRAAELIRHEGAMSGQSSTGAALDQVREVFRKHPSMTRSNLERYSRRYKALSILERDAVIKALGSEGAISIDGKRLYSEVYRQAA